MTDMSIAGLLDDYRAGRRTPREVIAGSMAVARSQQAANVWISLIDDNRLAALLERLEQCRADELPLYGVPFAIKDNIDLAGVPTTAGCPAFSYVPDADAPVIARLLAAGAIPIGKTNMDQFATGLVGTRSPYGTCHNPFDAAYVSGGSSAGSAVAVATGCVSFALGTDTAGSGRVPAAFNNIIGLKPSRGLISTRGVVPACRSLDVVSIFAGTATDARAVFDAAVDFDEQDPFSRAARAPALGRGSVRPEAFRFGVPSVRDLEFFGDDDARRLFDEAVERLGAVGGEAVSIDLEPFLEVARLLYEGPWVAERYAAVGAFVDAQPQAVLPVIREIIGGGRTITAAEGFKGAYRLRELRRRTEHVWDDIDLLVTPTAATLYRIAELLAEPVVLNSRLGRYTNFVNLLDLSAVAVPAGFRGDGLPLGVTLVAPAFHDQNLLAIADRLHRASGVPLGATGRPLPLPVSLQSAPLAGHDHADADADADADANAGTDGVAVAEIEIAVCGAHMSGLALNHQLTQRSARFVAATRSAPLYRLYALPDGPPQRPGLVRVAEGGAAVDLEVWSMPAQRFGDFVDAIPAPLGIGRVRLADGRDVAGFVCESVAVADATDITAFGGWRRYLAEQP